MDYSNTEKISLRPFLESIKSLCSGMSQENLTDFVMDYGKYLPAKERMTFLDNLMSFSGTGVFPGSDETLLDKISDLKDAVIERWESIEDGSYWDNHGWTPYDDEPDFLSDEQKEEVTDYFDEADTLFLADKFDKALCIYKELYSVFESDYSCCSSVESSVDINFRETKARYCRCLYETSTSAERAGNLLEGMDLGAALSSTSFNIYENFDPMLTDIRDAKLGELPEEKDFINDWIDLLKEIDTDRAQVLLLEAVYMRDGIPGVRDLARKWGDKQPRGYLFWLYLVQAEGNWPGVVEIGNEGFSILSHSDLRGQLASEVVKAGEKVGDSRIVLDAKRELFHSVSRESNLSILLKEAEKQNVFEDETADILSFFKGNVVEDKVLLVEVLLMRGELTKAYLIARDLDSLGWSYGQNRAGAVFYAGVLSALVIDTIDSAEIVKIILKRYIEGADPFIRQKILEGLRRTSISEKEQAEYLKWLVILGKKRIEDIVSNKHRSSYGKAAEILGGLAECLFLLGDRTGGYGMIYLYRDDIFNRYSAFKRELQEVLSKSRIL